MNDHETRNQKANDADPMQSRPFKFKMSMSLGFLNFKSINTSDLCYGHVQSRDELTCFNHRQTPSQARSLHGIQQPYKIYF